MATAQKHYQVALLGRPNVGKSTLFNRLLKRRQAVVSETAGTTRDRLQEIVTFNGSSFVLVDMAGIEPALTEKNEISMGMQRQVEQALADAAILVWVVDSSTGVTQQDEKVAELLRRLNKPVIVAVNKCDDPKHELMRYEFTRFGFEPILPISAVHARGIDELLNAVVKNLQELPPRNEVIEFDDQQDRELRLAIIGRPNVGKSTLLNALTGEDRAVVSPISGTTRDSVDTVLPARDFFDGTFTRFKDVRIIDTAGIRQRSKMGHTVEAWSVLRSMDTIDAAQVTLLVIDASEHMTHQDLTVAERILHAGRPLIIVANKWDLYLENRDIVPGTVEAEQAQEIFQAKLLNRAPFLAWCQLLFISAKEGFNIQYLGKLVVRAYNAWSREIDQTELDGLVTELKKTPRLRSLKHIEFGHAQPPVFIIHVDTTEILHFTVRRYVERALRDFFDLGPTPIKLWVEAKERKPRFRK